MITQRKTPSHVLVLNFYLIINKLINLCSSYMLYWTLLWYHSITRYTSFHNNSVERYLHYRNRCVNNHHVNRCIILYRVNTSRDRQAVVMHKVAIVVYLYRMDSQIYSDKKLVKNLIKNSKFKNLSWLPCVGSVHTLSYLEYFIQIIQSFGSFRGSSDTEEGHLAW